MRGAWLIAGAHLFWQTFCVFVLGGSWFFVFLACAILAALAAVHQRHKSQ